LIFVTVRRRSIADGSSLRPWRCSLTARDRLFDLLDPCVLLLREVAGVCLRELLKDAVALGDEIRLTGLGFVEALLDVHGGRGHGDRVGCFGNLGCKQGYCNLAPDPLPNLRPVPRILLRCLYCPSDVFNMLVALGLFVSD
jgi:hypothetical protein